MKRLLFFPVVLLIGCSSDRVVTREDVYMNEPPGSRLPEEERELVRNPEAVNDYGMNSYSDPNNPDIRHDAHNVQRVEKHSTWNLYPQQVSSSNQRALARLPEQQTNPYIATLEQELGRQKTVTKALMDQNQMLSEGLKTVEETASQTHTIIEENKKLRDEIESERKLKAEKESELKKQSENKPFWKFWE